MGEKCAVDPRDCPMEARVSSLEKLQERHSDTHREMFDRIRELEKSDAVQDAHYKAIDAKLDELTALVKDLTGKAGKRWESLVEKGIWAVAAAVIAFLLGRVGL